MNDTVHQAHATVGRRQSDWVAVAFSVLFSFTIYLVTASPGVAFHDSAELALRASQFGATHSPGAPVHTVLGFLLGKLFAEPATATNLLSMLGGSLAAGVACLLMLELVGSRIVAVGTALVAALLFPIWGNAVVTETYNLNLLFLSGCMLAGWRWRLSGDNGLLVLLAAFYGLALGAHFASILLLPAFLFLVFIAHPNALRNTVLFLGILLVALGLVALGNFVLASNVPPFGTTIPDSLKSLFVYMSGSEHAPLRITGPEFYVDRIVEHVLIFTRQSLFVLVPLGLLGGWLLLQQDRIYAVFLALIFAIYLSYFTLFGSGDYFTMVAPAYFVLCLWAGTALAWLAARSPALPLRVMVYSLLPVLVLVLLVIQFPARYAQAQSNHVKGYAERAFLEIPANSIVVSGWKEFTALTYYQQIAARRPDLRIILPARSLRHYAHGDVEDYRSYVVDRICDQPVVTDKLSDEIKADFDLQPLADQSDWYAMRPRTTGMCVASPP